MWHLFHKIKFVKNPPGQLGKNVVSRSERVTKDRLAGPYARRSNYYVIYARYELRASQD